MVVNRLVCVWRNEHSASRLSSMPCALIRAIGRPNYLLCLKVIVHNLFPERGQGKTHQTKVHFGPWYTNDGDAKQQTEAKMRERNPDTSDEEPQHIHKHVNATTALRTINDMRTEWPQGKYAKLHRSKAKGNANDGNHQYQ